MSKVTDRGLEIGRLLINIGTGSLPKCERNFPSPNLRLVYAAKRPYSDKIRSLCLCLIQIPDNSWEGGQIVTQAQALYASQSRR